MDGGRGFGIDRRCNARAAGIVLPCAEGGTGRVSRLRAISSASYRHIRAAAILAAVLALALHFAAGSAQAATIGVVATQGQPFEVLGNQVRRGAEIAAGRQGLSGELAFADDKCSAEGGAAAARQLIAAKVRIVVGFICTEAIEAALPLFKVAGIPVITPAVRADSLTDNRRKSGWPIFRLAPRADGERTAAAALLIPRWRKELYALVDDGTIYGRELVEAFRLSAEQAGLKSVFIDTYRPQMENQVGLASRLRRAGATHVLVGGDRQDVAVLARDAAGLGYDLTVAAGESLRSGQADAALPRGVLMVGLPEWSEIASTEAIEDFVAAKFTPEGYAIPAYAALEIAAAALKSAGGKPLAEVLAADEFSTTMGPIRFDPKGDLSQNPYQLFRYDGQRFIKLADQ